MKIYKWLAEPLSSSIGYCIVEVAPDESSDVENMLILIDGDSVGHFGIYVKLIGTGDFDPEWIKKNAGGKEYISGQFGYSRGSEIRKEKRYYEVMVNRD